MSSTFSEKNSWHKQWIVANQNKRIYGSSKMISIFLAPFHPIHPHCLPVEQTSTCLVCKHINCLANSFCTITGGRIWATIMCRKSYDTKSYVQTHCSKTFAKKNEYSPVELAVASSGSSALSDRACPSLVSGVQRSSAPPNLFSFQTKPFSFQAVPQPVSNWHIFPFMWKGRGEEGLSLETHKRLNFGKTQLFWARP